MEKKSNDYKQTDTLGKQKGLSLGLRIRELRVKKGMTQIDLAKGLCTPSMISQIESDRARPSYKMLSAVATKLDVPLEKLLVDVDMNLEYVSSYKMARAMLAAKQYASAIPLYQELLDTPRAQISTSEIMFDLGECLLHAGRYEEAEKKLSDVHELAVLRQDTKLTVEVLRSMGELACRQKNYQLAVYHWNKAIEEAEQMQDKDAPLQADILSKLGQVHLKMSYDRKAQEFFNRAASFYETLGNQQELARVYMDMGRSYKQANDLENAVYYSDRAISLFEGLERMEELWNCQIQTASLLAETGSVDEAEKILHAAIVQLQGIGIRELQGVALAELANVHLLKGEYEEAVETCRDARALLPELHVYQAKVNRILGKIALKQGDVTEGKRRLHMAADGYKRNRDIGKWDDTMFHLSELYQEEGDIEGALRTLTEMRRFTRQALSERGIEL